METSGGLLAEDTMMSTGQTQEGKFSYIFFISIIILGNSFFEMNSSFSVDKRSFGKNLVS